MKVLVVDDNSSIRKMATKALDFAGEFEVDTAENGEAALEKYNKFGPDVVILDISMPVMDGIEALTRLRQMDNNAVIIMASAAGSTTIVEDCIKRGALGFIDKPFSPKELVETIKKLVKPGTEYDIVYSLYSRIAGHIEKTMRKMTDDTLTIALKSVEFKGLEKKIVVPDEKIGITTEITGERTGMLVSLMYKQAIHQILSAQNESITPEEVTAATLELANVVNHDLINELIDYTGKKLKLVPPRLFDKEKDENVDTKEFIKITVERTWKDVQAEIIIYQCLN